MMKAVGLFRKKATRPFKDFYAEWMGTLKNALLPQLRRSLAASPAAHTALSSHVGRILSHFLAYYQALDAAASDDVAQILYPTWRNSLEKPFLWLGDLHPYLLTNLFRSFLDDDDDEGDNAEDFDCQFHETRHCRAFADFLKKPQMTPFSDKPWQVAVAWKNPSKCLTQRVEQVECGLRLMVPALTARARDAQAALVDKLAAHWMELEGGRKEEAVGEAITDHIEELVSVFVHANRLRRSVLAEIVSVMDVYQAALFFEGLAQFLVGFKDPVLVSEFEGCKVPLN